MNTGFGRYDAARKRRLHSRAAPIGGAVRPVFEDDAVLSQGRSNAIGISEALLFSSDCSGGDLFENHVLKRSVERFAPVYGIALDQSDKPGAPDQLLLQATALHWIFRAVDRAGNFVETRNRKRDVEVIQ